MTFVVSDLSEAQAFLNNLLRYGRSLDLVVCATKRMWLDDLARQAERECVADEKSCQVDHIFLRVGDNLVWFIPCGNGNRLRGFPKGKQLLVVKEGMLEDVFEKVVMGRLVPQKEKQGCDG